MGKAGVREKYSIAQLPAEERPRERLMRLGASTLSTAELLAILLGSGTKSQPVLQLANALLAAFGSLQAIAEATITELKGVKGVGDAKAIQIKAACSLAARLSRQSVNAKYRIEHPQQAYHYVKDLLEDHRQEHFVVVMLDSKGVVIAHQTVSIGSLSSAVVEAREVFYPAVRHSAASIIVAHNHPSGDPTPSQQDIAVTEVLLRAAKVMSIPIFDHIIVGNGLFVSLREQGTVSFGDNCN